MPLLNVSGRRFSDALPTPLRARFTDRAEAGHSTEAYPDYATRPDQRYRTSIQFITRSQAVNGPKPAIPRDADFTLEVMGHNLTEEKKRAFAEEAAAMLTPLVPVKLRKRIARLLGIKADSTRQIALQFNELSPAISDPFVVDRS